MDLESLGEELGSKTPSLKFAGQNEFLSYLSETCLFGNSFDESEGLNAFIRCIGENYDSVESLLQELDHINTMNQVCGRSIDLNEVYFLCLDCDLISPLQINTHYSLQCKECFMSSNHDGHRITSKVSDTGMGTCDCGDASAWDSKGFCPSHPGYTKEIVEQTYKKIPEHIRNGYITTLKEIFYALFEFLQDNPHKADIISPFIKLILQLHQQKDCFKFLTREVLTSKLPTAYKLRVNLQNLITFELKPETESCDCTFLELLIRFDFMFSKDVQNSIRGLILELIVFTDFKEIYLQLYLKLLHFYYYMGDYPNFPTPRLSKNCFLSYQLFIPEHFSLLAASYPESINFVNAIQRLLKNYDKMPRKKFYSFSFYGLSPAKYILEQQKPAEIMLQKPGFIEKMLEIIDLISVFDSTPTLDQFVTSFVSNQVIADYENITFAFKEYLNLLQSLYVRIFQLSDEKLRDRLISLVLKYFIALFEKRMKVEGPIKTGVIKLFPSIIVAFGDFLLVWYRFSKNEEDLKVSIFNELNSSGISKERFESIAQYVFQTGLLMINYICALQRLGEWAPHYKAFEEAVNFYLSSRLPKYCRIESTIICLLQCLINYDRNNDWVSSLAENILKTDASNQVIKREYVPYFFRTLHYVLTDDMSFNNLILQQNVKKVKDSNQFDSILKSIEFKVVLNFIYLHNQESFRSIKNSLESLIELKDDAIFQEITELDPKTNKLKPKETFRNKELDSGIFYLNAQLDNAFKAKLIEDSGINTGDSDSRTETFETENYNPLVKKRYIKDALLWAIICTYQCSKRNGKNIHLVVPLIASQIKSLDVLPMKEIKKILEKKIVGPDFVDVNKPSDKLDWEALTTTHEREYSLKDDLKIGLEILKKNDRGQTATTIISMTLSYEKILKRVYHTHEELKLEEEKIEHQIPVANTETVRDRLLAKQKLIREEFFLKQKRFLNKTAESPSESKEISEESKSFGVCVACREPLDDKEHNGYGLISFVSKSNLYQHCMAKRNNLKPKLGEGYLTLSTCNHFLHIDCLTKLRAFSTSPKLRSEVEFVCPLCKTLANQLIYVLGGNTSVGISKLKACDPGSFELNLVDASKIYSMLQKRKEEVVENNETWVEELFSSIQIHEILINQDLGLPESPVGNSYESLANAVVMAILETDLTGLQLLLQTRISLYTIVAQDLRKSAQIKSFNQNGTPQQPKIVECLKKMTNSKYISATAEKYLASRQLDFLEATWTGFLSVTEENLDLYSKFFIIMLNTNLVLEFLKLFYEDMHSKCSGNTKEMASAFTFDNFKDSCADNLFCELPNITSILRKFVALGLITGVYQYSPDSTILLDTELSMLQFLLCKKEKKDLISLITSFLSQNKAFFENLLIELQMLDLKIEFEDSNLSGLVLVPLPKKYQEFNSNVSKGKCCSCNSISRRGIALCLICGELYCIGPCDSKQAAPDQVGSMNTHSRNAHFGASVFIDRTYTIVMLVYFPRNIVRGYLYLGKLGQEIDPMKSNWEEFTISEHALDKIKKMVILGRIPQEIYLQTETSGQWLQENFL